MKKWWRAAEMNKSLIVALAVVVIVVLVVWGYKCRGSSAEKNEAAKELLDGTFYLTDTATGKVYEFPQAEAAKMPKKDGMVLVPETGEYTGKWGKPRRDVIIVPPEDEPEEP